MPLTREQKRELVSLLLLVPPALTFAGRTLLLGEAEGLVLRRDESNARLDLEGIVQQLEQLGADDVVAALLTNAAAYVPKTNVARDLQMMLDIIKKQSDSLTQPKPGVRVADAIREASEKLSEAQDANSVDRLQVNSASTGRGSLARLIRSRLPPVLATCVTDPMPVLIRADMPTYACIGQTTIDRWTYVCDWLSRSGIPGLVLTARLVNQVQATCFSEELSRWAASFVEGVFSLDAEGGGGDSGNESGGGGGGGGGLTCALKQLVENEAQRWEDLRREVERLPPNLRMSSQSLAWLEDCADIWGTMSWLIVGTRPESNEARLVESIPWVDHAPEKGPEFNEARLVESIPWVDHAPEKE